MNKIAVPLKVDSEDLIPTYSTQDASGADIRANVKEPVVIEPGAIAMIPTGIRVAIPSGFEIQVRPRSGLAAKNGITVLNTPGTIDADYRGEIAVILINCGKNSFTVTPKMRIAQLVLSPVVQANFILDGELLSATNRGEGGFGHKISDYLDVRLVLFLDLDSRDEAIEQLTDMIDGVGLLPNKKVFRDAIMHREQLVSTGIGMGVAIPHAKLSDIDQFFIAIGIQHKKGIEWNALDQAPVRLIFMIGGPDDRQSEYLQILSQLTVAIKDVDLRKEISQVGSPEAVIALFKNY